MITLFLLLESQLRPIFFSQIDFDVDLCTNSYVDIATSVIIMIIHMYNLLGLTETLQRAKPAGFTGGIYRLSGGRGGGGVQV